MLKFLCVHLLIFLTCIVDDLTNLLKEIMQEARNITNAEKCSVFLMESDVNELVAKVFDGDIASDEVSLHREFFIHLHYNVCFGHC